MATLYVTGLPATIALLASEVNKSLGFPLLGRRASDGAIMQPPPGKGPEEAQGVTLAYATMRAHPTNPLLAAFLYDDTTKPKVDALKKNDLRFLLVSKGTALGADWGT